MQISGSNQTPEQSRLGVILIASISTGLVVVAYTLVCCLGCYDECAHGTSSPTPGEKLSMLLFSVIMPYFCTVKPRDTRYRENQQTSAV